VISVSSPTASQPVSRAVDHEVERTGGPRPASDAGVPRRPDQPTHEVRIVDGRFMHAECSCGWRTAGRRNRATVRAEARDHALLHAGTAQ
jgi:hypothetical protein